MFDGELLHGVVPGRGLNAFINNDSYTDEKSTPLPTRTTLMIAFWDDIEVPDRLVPSRLGASDLSTSEGREGALAKLIQY